MSKLPEAGELVCIMPSEKFLHPHTVGLYLDDGKVVLASHVEGWTVADIEELDNYSAFGKSNIRKTYYDDDAVVGYDYLAYDSGKPTVLNLRKIDGSWVIQNQFEAPSWAERKSRIEKSQTEILALDSHTTDSESP